MQWHKYKNNTPSIFSQVRYEGGQCIHRPYPALFTGRKVVSDRPSVFTKTIFFKYSQKKSTRNLSTSLQSANVVLKDKVHGRQYHHHHLKIILPTPINYTQCRYKTLKKPTFQITPKNWIFLPSRHQPTWVNKKTWSFKFFLPQTDQKGRSTQYHHSSAHTIFPKTQ